MRGYSALTVWLGFLPLAMALAYEVIERARVRSGVSHKELALCQEIPPSQWCRQLHNVNGEHPHFDRIIERTPDHFVACLLQEIAAAKRFVLRETFRLEAQ